MCYVIPAEIKAYIIGLFLSYWIGWGEYLWRRKLQQSLLSVWLVFWISGLSFLHKRQMFHQNQFSLLKLVPQAGAKKMAIQFILIKMETNWLALLQLRAAAIVLTVMDICRQVWLMLVANSIILMMQVKWYWIRHCRSMAAGIILVKMDQQFWIL